MFEIVLSMPLPVAKLTVKPTRYQAGFHDTQQLLLYLSPLFNMKLK